MTNEELAKAIARPDGGATIHSVAERALSLLNEHRPEHPWLDSPDGDGWWEWHTQCSEGAARVSMEHTNHGSFARCRYPGTEPWSAPVSGAQWRRLTLSSPPQELPDRPMCCHATIKGTKERRVGVFRPPNTCLLESGSNGLVSYRADELTDIKWLGD